MKRLLLILGAVILVMGGLMAPAFADEAGEVTVTANPAQVEVTVNPETVGYGMVEIPSLANKLVEPEPDGSIRARNAGNCWVDFLIMGADTTDWALGSDPGNNIYVHYFGWPPPGPYTPLTKLTQDLTDEVSYAPGSGQSFRLRMDTPTETTYFGVQATTVTVIAVWVEKGISATLAIEVVGDTATLTLTVVDENDAPLTGLLSDAFRTMLSPAGPPFDYEKVEPQPTFTETTTDGEYTSVTPHLDISGLAPGGYSVSVSVIDTLLRVANDSAGFTKP